MYRFYITAPGAYGCKWEYNELYTKPLRFRIILPSIICPVVISPIQCGSTPNFGSPTAADACDVTTAFADVVPDHHKLLM
jgi:hypothetical protein